MALKTKSPLLELKQVVSLANRHQAHEFAILNGINLTIHQGDFIIVLGTNGAGKSTLFNVIAGNQAIDSGKILHQGQDMTHLRAEKRAAFIARVFQDPKLGTAPRMSVAENLLLAAKRGQKRRLAWRNLTTNLLAFKKRLQVMHDGLENRLSTPTQLLSGGQRQALSFVMATLNSPDILLLDEHTAALDPKTSARLMQQTDQQVREQHLTCLMITHRLEDALNYGNRLIILSHGQLVADLDQQAKAALDKPQLLAYLDELP